MFNYPMGVGPHEKQTHESEADRKNELTLDRIAIYGAIIILLVLEALLFGENFGPLCSAAFAVLFVEVELSPLSISTKPLNKLSAILAACGVVFTALAFTVWPVGFSVDSDVMWIYYPGGGLSVSLLWVWPRYLLLVFIPIVIGLLLTNDLRTKMEIIAPNWLNSFRARAGNAEGEIAKEIGMVYPTPGETNEDESTTAVPNAPVY